MLTRLLTDPAVPGANEDAAGVLGDAAVLLDGAGVAPQHRAGCRHSVAWYSHTLATHLLGALLDPDRSLQDALRQAIIEVAALHEDTCELAAGGPSATVVAVRIAGDQLDYLVLCDSSLLLEHVDGAITRITDTRVDEVVRQEREAGSPAGAVEARRNAPGGFWLARHESEAADEARCGTVPLAGLHAVHLVSDGVTRTVDLFGIHDDASLSAALTADPCELLHDLRRTERELPPGRRPRKLHDDATILTIMC